MALNEGKMEGGLGLTKILGITCTSVIGLAIFRTIIYPQIKWYKMCKKMNGPKQHWLWGALHIVRSAVDALHYDVKWSKEVPLLLLLLLFIYLLLLLLFVINFYYYYLFLCYFLFFYLIEIYFIFSIILIKIK